MAYLQLPIRQLWVLHVLAVLGPQALLQPLHGGLLLRLQTLEGHWGAQTTQSEASVFIRGSTSL